MRLGVIQQVSYIGGVDIGKSEQSSREVSRVVIGAEHTTELRVKYCFYFVPGTDNITPIAGMETNTNSIIYITAN